MSQPFPGLPGADRMPPKAPRPRRAPTRREWLAAATILVALWFGWHVIPALAARDTPPLACQLAGGSWNIWTGWNCG